MMAGCSSDNFIVSHRWVNMYSISKPTPRWFGEKATSSVSKRILNLSGDFDELIAFFPIQNILTDSGAWHMDGCVDAGSCGSLKHWGLGRKPVVLFRLLFLYRIHQESFRFPLLLGHERERRNRSGTVARRCNRENRDIPIGVLEVPGDSSESRTAFIPTKCSFFSQWTGREAVERGMLDIPPFYHPRSAEPAR
jgi:hypothetical protein